MASILKRSACSTPFGAGGQPVTTRKADEWTIDRWRTDPGLVGLEFTDATVEEAPPLWKDLTLASAIAVLLWGAAAIVLR
jgi:hypothetical protein